MEKEAEESTYYFYNMIYKINILYKLYNSKKGWKRFWRKR